VKIVGVIGGSGLYDMPGLEDVERVRLTTPFGDPSDEFVCGTLSGTRLVFLPRHGRGHRILPSELNFRTVPARSSATASSPTLALPIRSAPWLARR
jgi:purine nucleoside phosphorylase